MTKRQRLAFSLMVVIAWVALYLCTPNLNAQPSFHTVEQGDTLWSICEKYYGDSELWPKLWQLNPFVTNPHLLKPGDRIRLLDLRPEKRKFRPSTAPAMSQPMAKSEETPAFFSSGIFLPALTNTDYCGFFSRQEIVPAGRIVSAGTDRILLAQGDVVLVEVADSQNCMPGDIMAFYDIAGSLKDDENRKIGSVVSVLGRLVLKSEMKKNRFKALIVETNNPVYVGTSFIRYRQAPECLVPLRARDTIATEIVAAADMLQVIGNNSVVFLADGRNQGIRTGLLLGIVKKWRERKEDSPLMPEEIIGYLLVIDTQKDSATALVLSTLEEIPVGTQVISVGRHLIEDTLPKVPRCRVE